MYTKISKRHDFYEKLTKARMNQSTFQVMKMKEEFGAPKILLVYQEFDSVGEIQSRRKAELFPNLNRALECRYIVSFHFMFLVMIMLYEKKL